MTVSCAEDVWSADIVPAASLSEELRQKWRSFIEAASSFESPFYSVAFTQAVAQVRPDVYVGVFYRASQIQGFLPFQFVSSWHRMLGAAERVGGNMSDYFGLVAANGVRLDQQTLLRLCRLTSLEFTHMDETQSRFGLNGEHPESGLRIRLSGGSEVYWNELRRTERKLVADTERRLRKLVNTCGPLRFEMRASDNKVELARLIAAKRAQYHRTGVKDALAAGWSENLLGILAETHDPQCEGILSILFAGDTWVASHFGLCSGRMLHYWFPVYNPDLKAFSPGRLLLKSIIDATDTSGIRLIDRGVGDQQAKRAFANDLHFYLRDLWFVPGPRSFLFRAARSMRWRFAAKHEPTAEDVRSLDSE